MDEVKECLSDRNKRLKTFSACEGCDGDSIMCRCCMNPVTVEESKYRIEPEDTQWENDRVGWSKMVDKGIINDYWREYHIWNGTDRKL